MDHKTKVAGLRKAIKAQAPTVKVTMDRGTAWGWVTISGSGSEYGEFTASELDQLRAMGFSPCANTCGISYENVDRTLARLTA